MLSREQAWDIVCEFTKSEGLRKHALAVETCVDGVRAQTRRGRAAMEPHRAAARFRLGDPPARSGPSA